MFPPKFFPTASLGDTFVFGGAYYEGDAGFAFEDPVWPFDQSVRPNVVTLTNLTGAYTDIDDDPSSPDAAWLLA